MCGRGTAGSAQSTKSSEYIFCFVWSKNCRSFLCNKLPHPTTKHCCSSSYGMDDDAATSDGCNQSSRKDANVDDDNIHHKEKNKEKE